MPSPEVLLSTTAVFPEATSAAFALAAELGYDGVELMAGADAASLDEEVIAQFSDAHAVPVRSVHAPTLLITPSAWGRDPWEKLRRSAEAARRLGADIVVVHPPFRWQRGYADEFIDGIRELNRTSGVTFAVENMFPWRTFAGEFMAYSPGWDPTELDYDHLTLDLSHASTARQRSLDLVAAWGDRLTHVHLTDGSGSFKDEHLLPGEGDQEAWRVVRDLAHRGYEGHVVHEVSTRRATSREERAELLAGLLARTRRELASRDAEGSEE
ncbi:sugar phosphate isomerase/epimerase [Arachnia propionica]|uniref:Sugar phosphate isomerase/epimerase n=1 Tax=Arachnia propionica TaxID=1750 RepID=A0A3P1TAE6_9ACTN|nr:sugar phosphate isomerase/epimerase family protein [Arachnia propionica]MDO5083802.1 sugar phosphate isomerase/epimerase family protein [Arachnia propionica]RRD05433.1 sugar phosphate isomerase/epimerase [Arachnia propionica]